MSKRAEDFALKKWPILISQRSDINSSHRSACIQGYEQAEKDIWNKIEKYLSEQAPGNYATAGFILKNFEYFKQQIMEE